MTAVWVRLDEAQRGSLPARCARTGERSITRFPHPVTDLAPALEWATWTRLWPRQREVEPPVVIVPLLPSRQRAATVLRRTRDVTAALLPVLLIALLLADGVLARLFGALAVTAVLLHVVVAVLGVQITVRLRPDTSGDWVQLSGVHPEFVALTEAATTRPATPPVLEEGQTARVRGAASGNPVEP